MRNRSILESLRARGVRLAGEDDEYLQDRENADHYFCESCGTYFASPSDEAKMQEDLRRFHVESEMHREGLTR